MNHLMNSALALCVLLLLSAFGGMTVKASESGQRLSLRNAAQISAVLIEARTIRQMPGRACLPKSRCLPETEHLCSTCAISIPSLRAPQVPRARYFSLAESTPVMFLIANMERKPPRG